MRVSKLKIGMYVAKLDKDWKDSPFIFQGFPIENKKQLDLLIKECREVYVDFKTEEEYEVHLRDAGEFIEVEVKVEVKEDEIPDEVKLAEELSVAYKYLDGATKSFKELMHDVAQGKEIDLTDVERSVVNCINSVKRFPDALLLAINDKHGIHYTAEHCVRVSVLAIAFGLSLDMSPQQVRALGLSGMLYDIGKSRMPPKIINKSGKLTKDEAMVIKNHPTRSFRLLSQVEGLSKIVKEVALSHHEREDGNGYPRHIPKDRVSRYAKIISIIDVYDAVTSDRAYNKANKPAFAFNVLNKEKGKKFDGYLVDRFVEWMRTFPVGSLVEMVTGELAIVLSKPFESNLLPRIMIITDENKNTGYEKVIDLSAVVMHPSGKPYKIKKVMEDNTFDINVRRYLDNEKYDTPRWCKKVGGSKDSPFSKYL